MMDVCLFHTVKDLLNILSRVSVVDPREHCRLDSFVGKHACVVYLRCRLGIFVSWTPESKRRCGSSFMATKPNMLLYKLKDVCGAIGMRYVIDVPGRKSIEFTQLVFHGVARCSAMFRYTVASSQL